MEMGHLQYDSIMKMPVKRFLNYLKWKTDLEEDKQKLYTEYANTLKG